MSAIKSEATDELYLRLGARLNDPDLTNAELETMVRNELDSVLAEIGSVALSTIERGRLVNDVYADVAGLGPLELLLGDEEVSEIMVNGPSRVYVERQGRLTLSDTVFKDEKHLRAVIERIVSRVGRRIDESSPMVDARLADGSRVNAIIAPLAVSGSALTIRKFSKEKLRIADLIGFGSLTEEMADFLDRCVRGRLNIMVSGGTGTGKTTLLNVLSSFIPPDERIITVEDSMELQMQQEHVIQLEARPANVEGRGAVSIRDLIANTLRMRPDRIIVGEVRSGEALDMLQAMNTGHDGSMSTTHSNSARDCIARLETLVLMAGMDLPSRAIREQISSAVDLIVQISRLRDGTRRITSISEVQRMEGEVVTLQDLFKFDFSAGVDAEGRYLGIGKPTGVRPGFTGKLEDQGIALPPYLFGPVMQEPR